MENTYAIGFLLINEHSSFNAAFGLASVIKKRGHRVIFFVHDETVFYQHVEEHGFESVKIAPPAGHGPRSRPVAPKWKLWKRLRNHAHAVKANQGYLRDLIKANALDLLFLDSIYSYPYALVAAETNVPMILLFYTYGARMSTAYPPVFSATIPPEHGPPDIRLRLVYYLLWLWAVFTKGRSRSYNFLEYVFLSVKKIAYRLYQIDFEGKLRRLGLKPTWSEWSRMPMLPEIVFGHCLLDWRAVSSNPQRCYFGTTDQFRKKFGFDWSGIERKGPIVYCNISTAHGFERIRATGSKSSAIKVDFSKRKFYLTNRFVEVMLSAFTQKKEWQLIMACGPFYHVLNSRTLPANIHIFKRVPQLDVLERADLAITWGGAGTIRECINFGVPLLVFPFWTDQFGNAARVSYFNVGIRGDILNITSPKLVKMIEEVFNDTTIRDAITDMKKVCNSNDEIQNLIDFVESQTSLKL